MVIGHRPVRIISNTVMSDLIESHICVSVCVHVYAAYLDTQNINTLFERQHQQNLGIFAYAYVVDVHVTPECGYFWMLSDEHFWA